MDEKALGNSVPLLIFLFMNYKIKKSLKINKTSEGQKNMSVHLSEHLLRNSTEAVIAQTQWSFYIHGQILNQNATSAMFKRFEVIFDSAYIKAAFLQ